MSQLFGQHPLAGHFNRLTPEQILKAVDNTDRITTGRFVILNSYENRVYQLEIEDESRIVGKFYRPGRWTKAAILDEHLFTQELHDVEIPVALPLTIDEGSTLGETDGIYYALYTSVGGRSPQELSDPQIETLGRLLARIHNVGAQHDAPNRVRLTPDTYGHENLNFLLEHDLIATESRDNYAQTVNYLIELISPLFKGINTLRLHGDCHLGNLIWTPSGPTFLDFDDMVVGPAIQDIWMLLPSYDQEGQRQRQIFLEAYRSFRPIEHREIHLIEPLRALRFIHYSAWIGRRWSDPLFKKTFSHFGDLLYWQKEVQDLREQIGRIQQTLDSTYM
jgi:Ser/Thr protein kinase RdoA (MazF antagonist)